MRYADTTRAALGLVIGAALGIALGLAWSALFVEYEEMFGGLVAGLKGGVVGGVTGGSWGWTWRDLRRLPYPTRILMVAAWLACGTILVVGVVYIGSWTDSGGPDIEGMIGILGIPVGLTGLWLIARFLHRHADSHS